MLKVFKKLSLTLISNLVADSASILFLDIDDTLLKAQNIFIYYSKDGVNKTYTPEEYATLNVQYDDKKYYDYSDFSNPEIIRNSILTAKPLTANLLDVDNFILEGFELGILTARGQEDVIAKIMPSWLNNNLKNKFPKIRRENIYGTGDKIKKYPGITDGERKLNVLKTYIESGKYKNIVFIDDNLFTIELIRKYNKSVQKDKQIQLIVAK